MYNQIKLERYLVTYIDATLALNVQSVKNIDFKPDQSLIIRLWKSVLELIHIHCGFSKACSYSGLIA